LRVNTVFSQAVLEAVVVDGRGNTRREFKYGGGEY
jgi:hypothetical protein